MRVVQTSQVIAESTFNKFHLLVFLWCFYAMRLTVLILHFME